MGVWLARGKRKLVYFPCPGRRSIVEYRQLRGVRLRKGCGVQARRIDVIVVYKVDRLTRSLADFAKLVETFDAHGVSFVSVHQSFNTTTSMGRLTLNVLLSFAQFEREVTGERIRDKIAASKKKGMWMGGVVLLGYRVEDRALHIVEDHAAIVRPLFGRYLSGAQHARWSQWRTGDRQARSFSNPCRTT